MYNVLRFLGGGYSGHTVGVGVKGVLSEGENNFIVHLLGFWWVFGLN